MRCVYAAGLSMLLIPLTAGGLRAGSGDAKATPRPERPLLKKVSHVILDPFGWGSPTAAEPYRFPSKYYGPWEPVEVFGHDARCAPTPYAPRGYGFPKKLAPYRMDYTPYRLHDCAMDSLHGPSLWMRHHRDPCCDPACEACRCGKHLDWSVDPQ